MNKPALVDTGPLVALLRSDDAMHVIAVAQAVELPPPFFTTWAVLTEAAWLLRSVPRGLDALLSAIETGLIQPRVIPLDAIASLKRRCAHYHDLRPQLADLTLCWLAEQQRNCVIFTFDRRDFLVFRNSAGEPYEIFPS